MKPVIFTTLLACLPGFTSADTAADKPGADERFRMIDALTSIAAGADRHDWPRVRAAFADEVMLDYTSLWGGAAQTVAADDIIVQWSGFLLGFDKTHHLVTNYTVVNFDGDSAVMEADFQASHRIDEAQWILLGRYTYGMEKHVEGWRVNGMTMTWTHEQGDRGLVAKAAERAAQ